MDPPEILLEQGGLVLERQRWSFGIARGQAWRARVELPGSTRVVGSDQVAPFERFLPSDEGPWAAINGGFYYPAGHAMGLVVADGQEISPFRRGGGSGVFEVTGNGPRIVHRNQWSPGAAQALQSIDRIADEGRTLVQQRHDQPAARSAIAVGERFLWMVVLAEDVSIVEADGVVELSFTSFSGLPLWAFADYLLLTTDIRTALNLDGGVSTQMAVRAAGRDFRVRGERGTISALVTRPQAQED